MCKIMPSSLKINPTSSLFMNQTTGKSPQIQNCTIHDTQQKNLRNKQLSSSHIISSYKDSSQAFKLPSQLCILSCPQAPAGVMSSRAVSFFSM